MTFLSTTRSHTTRARRSTSLFDLIALYGQRRALTRLDDAALKDVGLSRKDALQEAGRPIWDVPAHWVK